MQIDPRNIITSDKGKKYLRGCKQRIKELFIVYDGDLRQTQMKIYAESIVDVSLNDLSDLLNSRSFESVRQKINTGKLRTIEDKLFQLANGNNLKAIELYLKRVDEKSKSETNSDINIKLNLPKDLSEFHKVESDREICDKRDENE